MQIVSFVQSVKYINYKNMNDDYEQDDELKKIQQELDAMPDDEDDDLFDDEDQESKKLQWELREGGLPEATQINTFFAIEEFIQLADFLKDQQYVLKLLEKKQKLLNFAKEGKITAQKYKPMLHKIDVTGLTDQTLINCITKEKQLEEKIGNRQQWFNKMVSRFSSTLAAQQKKAGIKKPEVKTVTVEIKKPTQQKTAQNVGGKIPSTGVAIKQHVEPVKQPQNKQQQMIAKLDEQGLEKKAEIILRATSKIESLILYYKQNMLQAKTKQLKEVLLPKREYCLKIVKALLEGKNVPIGGYYVTNLGKLDFETFHGCPRRQYQSTLEGIAKKYKIIQKNQKEFKKKCSRSANQNNNALARSSELLKSYEQDLQYLMAIKNKDFVPVPLTRLAIQQRQNYSQNTKLQKNDLQVIIKQIEGLHEHCQMLIYFEDMGNPKKTFEVDNGEQKMDFILKASEGAMKEINKKMIKIRFQHKKMIFFKGEEASMDIDFNEFVNKNCMEGVTENNGVKVTYELNIRLPRNKVSKTKVQSISMKRLPEYIHTEDFEVEFIKKYMNFSTATVQQIQAPQVKPEQQKSVTVGKPELFYIERSQVLQGQLKSIQVQNLKPDQISRPQIYSDCIPYLNKMNECLDKAMNQLYSYKKNKQLIEEIQDEVMKKAMTLENYRKSNKMPNQKYAELLQNNLNADKILLNTFQKNQLKTFADFISIRIQMITQELTTVSVNSNVKPAQQPSQQQTQQTSSTTTKPQIPSTTTITKAVEASIDLSKYPLIYVCRTEENRKVLDSISKPIDFVEPEKIKNPEKSCYSLKFLTEFDKVLDGAINEYSVGNKFNKNFAESLQDDIMKNQGVITKKKAAMTPEQYKALIKAAIQTDKKLISIYKKLGVQEFVNFLLGRIKVMKQEIGQPLTLEVEKDCGFDTNEQRQLFQLKYTENIIKVLEKFGPEIKNPENPEFCQCMSYFQKLLEISKDEKLIAKTNSIKDALMQKIQNGEVTEEQYGASLNKFKDEDINRLDIYKKLGLKEMYLFVKARIRIVEKELAGEQ